jgi:hypothetical protein
VRTAHGLLCGQVRRQGSNQARHGSHTLEGRPLELHATLFSMHKNMQVLGYSLSRPGGGRLVRLYLPLSLLFCGFE